MCRDRERGAGAPPRPHYPTRTIQLFDSKYIGSFNTHTECVAFVKGIESVLNYLLKAKDAKSSKAVLDDMLQAKGCEPEE